MHAAASSARSPAADKATARSTCIPISGPMRPDASASVARRSSISRASAPRPQAISTRARATMMTSRFTGFSVSGEW